MKTPSKRKPVPKQIADLAHGLSCLVANMKFSPGDAVAIADALAEIMAAVSRSKDCEERLKLLERELKSAPGKKAPVIALKEVG